MSAAPTIPTPTSPTSPTPTGPDAQPATVRAGGRHGRLADDPVAVLVLLALAVHAAAGEPTPDRVGLAPAVSAALLSLALGGAILAGGRSDRRATPAAGPPPWSAAGLVVLAFGLGALPLFGGALRGWPAVEVARDLIGLAALAAPVVFRAAAAGRRDPAAASARLAAAVAAGLVLIGVGHALRFLAAVDAAPGTLGVAGGADGGRYLAGGPAVVFAAVALGSRAITATIAGPRAALTRALPAALAAAPCLLVLAMTLQRAALAAVAIALLAVLIGSVRRRPAAAGGLALAGIAGLAAVAPALGDLAAALVEKTRTVGANHRVEELAAVAGALGRDPAAALFGQGWGAMIALPAIAEDPVSFVHALPLYLAWKTGLVGLALASAWLVLVLRLAVRSDAKRRGETAGVLAALAVAVTVQPGFKTLSFALLLSLPLLRLSYHRR